MSAVNINFIVLSFFCHVVCNKNSASRETPPNHVRVSWKPIGLSLIKFTCT